MLQCKPLRSKIDSLDNNLTVENHYDLLAVFNDRSRASSINFCEVLVNEVFNNIHVDLPEDLVRVIDLYMYGKNHYFVFHEKRSRGLEVLSLNHDIRENLIPCNANIWSNTEEGVIQMLLGRKLLGFDICDDEDGDPNLLEIMTDKGSVFLVPDETANWWLNRDSKFMDLPAFYGFNDIIEDARVIIRPTGPYLHLVVRPSDHEGSVKCSN